MTSRFSSTLVIGVLGALGVVAWGCGTGDEGHYYCDSTGCFQCDAYGCSSVTPPAHASCTGTSSCPPGSICTAAGCTSSCSTYAECPRGETCQDGFCSPPGRSAGPAVECTTKADCADGQTCTGGTCEACGGNAGPCPCSATTDCSGGLTCVAGACTPPQDACKYSSECADDKICADGQCLTSCDAGKCADGFTCDKGVCKPTPGGGVTGPACTADRDCTSADTPNCVGGSCVRSCTTDPECGDGKFCNQGACVIDTRPTAPNCTTDDECNGTTGPARKCLGGYCKFSCTDNSYCRTIDTRIGYCAKDGVCRNGAEANAACFGGGDCPDSQTCIDNQCR